MNGAMEPKNVRFETAIKIITRFAVALTIDDDSRKRNAPAIFYKSLFIH